MSGTMSERAPEARKGVQVTIPGHHFTDKVVPVTSNDYKAFSVRGKREAMTKHAGIPDNSSVV